MNSGQLEAAQESLAIIGRHLGKIATVLGGLPIPAHYSKLAKIRLAVAETLDIPESEVMRTHGNARQLVMYLLRQRTPYSLPTIARIVGVKNHSTVLYAHRNVIKALAANPALRRDVKAINESLDKTEAANGN